MKNEMKRIINETNEDRFITYYYNLCNIYLLKLQEANEIDFVNYLIRYYFQDEERIKMWAHCYRRNSGINTNMAIESFNNLLKTNQLKRNANVTIEKLLDTIDDLVDIKMWKRIVDIERANANYQDRIIMKAHKKAESIKNKVKVKEDTQVYGQFKVASFRDSNILYNVNLKQVCENECRTLYCRVCKICIHRYQCECSEYVVKNTLCKHVHLVRMYEERMHTNSVLDEVAKCLGENSVIKPQHEEEINDFIRDKIGEANQAADEVQAQSTRSLQWENLQNFVERLDDDNFTEFMKGIQGTVNCKKKQIKLHKNEKWRNRNIFLPTNTQNPRITRKKKLIVDIDI